MYDVAGSGTEDVDYTPSNVVLQGRWAIVNNFGDAPDWYVVKELSSVCYTVYLYKVMVYNVYWSPYLI